MSVKSELNDFRFRVKEQICNILTDKFKELNDGLLPDWSNDEEIYIEGDEIGLHLKVNVEVSNTYDENRCFEEWVISSYIVTLDYNLFFNCDDNELDWKEISTDDLVGICYALQNKL
jgi:hypothetical protein